MINGFLTFLTVRKKGYTGRSSNAMYYDEKKKRYVIEGEEESDEDVPPPPPPKKQIVQEEKKAEAPAKEESATDMLTRPGFSGALANRGRGRGRGAPVNRFPQTFAAGAISESTFKPAAALLEADSQPKMTLTSANEERSNDAPNQQIDPPQTPRLVAENSQEQSVLYTTTLDISINQTALAHSTILEAAKE